MSFTTALSGLNAAQNNLSVTGNNIANANTTGFKKSRSEFADVYASNMGGASKVQPGGGVRVMQVAQQFEQGNIEYTENSLDLALSGTGFFSLADNPQAATPTMYTRSGAFKLDKDGYVVNDQGRYLMTYAPNGTKVEAGFSQGIFQPIQIDTAQGLPEATEKVNLQVNLDATADKLQAANFDPTDPTTYNNMTSATVYDSQGNPHTATTYFLADGTSTTPPTLDNPNSWLVYTYLDGFGITPGGGVTDPANQAAVPTPISLKFDTAGALLSIDGNTTTQQSFGPITSTDLNPNLLVNPIDLEYNFANSTQYSTPYSVNALTQDGLPAGNLTGIDVDDKGIVFARFSNGGSRTLGQVALARFANNQGLSKIGDTTWAENASSGQPVFGAAGSNNFGSIQSAALESSNVDLSAQLVNLIVAQQSYQANSQTISTENQIIQTILNIR